MKYIIKTTNNRNCRTMSAPLLDHQHAANPLNKLDGAEYATRKEACEAIYSAMYDVIDSADGCEMVDKTDYLNYRGSNYYVAKIKCYAAGDESRMGGAWVWCGDNERNWERQSDTTDGGLSMTYSDAVTMVQRLESEQYVMGNGEFGRPDYYIIDDRTHDWLCAPYDSGKYDSPDEELSDDEIVAWTNRRDEEHVREHAISNDDDRQLADDEANNRWHSWYIEKCRDYIYREGRATEDGVTATVESVPLTFDDLTKCGATPVEVGPVELSEGLSLTATCWTDDEEVLDDPAFFDIRSSWGDGTIGRFDRSQEVKDAIEKLAQMIAEKVGGKWRVNDGEAVTIMEDAE